MKTFITILFSVLSLTAFAQKKSVAVLNPICRDNSVNTFYQQIVRGSMESAVTVTDEYIAFDRTAFDKVLEEHKFQQSGVVDEKQIRRMGAYAGVDLILVTEVSSYDGYMTVLVKILNIETGESSKGVSELMEQTPPVVQSSCKELAKKLFGIVDFVSGLRKGTLQMLEGRYEGEIQNGKPHGIGKMYYNENNENLRVSYDGEWKNGIISGQGTMIWTSGDKYIGCWVNDRKSGKGTMYLATGNRIETTYKNGIAHGVITIYFSDGDKYVGIAQHGKLMIGKGTWFFNDGKKYVGQFEWDEEKGGGRVEGFGVLYSANGEKIFEGTWKNNEKHGEGTAYSSDYKICGKWVNDVLDGFAHIYYNKDNDMEEYGYFVNGKQDGEWTRKFKQGLGGFYKYQKGRYSNGVMTSQYR